MRNLTRTFACLLLLGVFISGIFFVSEDPYSINKKQTIFGETRSVTQLIFSTNRLELKEKIEITILNSEIRNSTLKTLASTTWKFQENSNFLDYQFFNTEIFYGKKGEVFPKYTTCSSYNFKNIEINEIDDTKIIFLLMPLKQEIESHRLHSLYEDIAVCDNSRNFDIFKNEFQNDSIKILDIYEIFNSNDKRYYESGDTHWNDLGVKKVFSEIIKISHNVKELQLKESGIKKENNLILKRLGLVDKTVFQNEYKINFESNENKKLLVIHDSFFEKFYVSEEFLNQYFESEYLSWSEFQNMSKNDANNLLKKYEFVIVESSIDTFFEERVLVFSK